MPSPVSMSRSLISFRRTTLPLRRYWLSPPRKTRRPMVMRPSSERGKEGSVARVRVHSAIPSGLRFSAPLKMTSSMVPPRRDLALCSPSTQVIASDRLLLPQPLGPTMAVTPPESSTVTGSTKDLKPEISSDSTFSMAVSSRPHRSASPKSNRYPGLGRLGYKDQRPLPLVPVRGRAYQILCADGQPPPRCLAAWLRGSAAVPWTGQLLGAGRGGPAQGGLAEPRVVEAAPQQQRQRQLEGQVEEVLAEAPEVAREGAVVGEAPGAELGGVGELGEEDDQHDVVGDGDHGGGAQVEQALAPRQAR